MATSIPAVGPGWGDGVTLAAQALRLLTVSAEMPVSTGVQVLGGVHPGAGDPLKVTGSGGMTTSVNPGHATVQGTVSGTQGAYRAALTTAGTLTHAGSDPSNPRNDLIVVTVIDNGDATSNVVVQIVQGTPAASPSDPTPPANSLKLARVLIPASATSVGTITDLRPYAYGLGGMPLSTFAAPPAAPYLGMVTAVTDLAGLAIYDGSVFQFAGGVSAPRGVVAKAKLLGNSSAFNSATPVTVQTLAGVPMVSGRRYRITSYMPIGNASASHVAGDLMRFKHKIGATVKNTRYELSAAAVTGLVGNSVEMITLIDDATTGTFTVTTTGENVSGSGSHQLLVDGAGATLMLPWMTVEDLGTGG